MIVREWVGLRGIPVLFEEKFIYFPSKYPQGMGELPEIASEEGRIVPRIKEAWFKARDGVKLNGWICDPHRKESGSHLPIATEMVLLFFHGNGGCIADRYDLILGLVTLPVRVFIIDYRGYGKSEGRPTERGLYLDGEAAWAYLVNEQGISTKRIVLLGKSLGGAVAIELATHVEVAGLIVQSSFTSIPDMAKCMIPFLPRFLIRTKMDSIKKIPRVHCPKLFVHSPSDETVPFEFGRRLFRAASEPKRFYEVPGAPHNETYFVAGEAYLDALRRFVQACTPSPTNLTGS